MLPPVSLLPDARPATRHKWRVAGSLMLIYYPILVYLNYPHWGYTWLDLLRTAPSVLTGAAVILLVFRGWINVVEWTQDWLYRRSGEEFSLEMRWPAQLATVGICIVLSVGLLRCLVPLCIFWMISWPAWA